MIDLLSTLICNFAGKLAGLIPAGGIIMGWGVSWLIGKLLNSIFTDRKKEKIANHFYINLNSLTNPQKWFITFLEALNA